MVITDVQTVSFKYISKMVRDSDGHGQPGPPHEAIQTLLKILTDEGVEGYWFGANAAVIEKTIKPAIVGQDPFMRERIWQDLMERQRLNLSTLADNILAPTSTPYPRSEHRDTMCTVGIAIAIQQLNPATHNNAVN